MLTPSERLGISWHLATPNWLPIALAMLLLAAPLASCMHGTRTALAVAPSIASPDLTAPPAPFPPEIDLPDTDGQPVTLAWGDYVELIGYLNELADYPELCRVAISGVNSVWHDRTRTSARILAAQMAREQVAESVSRSRLWPWWQVLAVGVIVFAVTAPVGVALGWVAGL